MHYLLLWHPFVIAGVDYKLDCFNKMPLHRRKRLSNRKNRSHSVSVPAHSSVRPFAKRKQWTNEQMFGAMKAVQAVAVQLIVLQSSMECHGPL